MVVLFPAAIGFLETLFFLLAVLRKRMVKRASVSVTATAVQAVAAVVVIHGMDCSTLLHKTGKNWWYIGVCDLEEGRKGIND